MQNSLCESWYWGICEKGTWSWSKKLIFLENGEGSQGLKPNSVVLSSYSWLQAQDQPLIMLGGCHARVQNWFCFMQDLSLNPCILFPNPVKLTLKGGTSVPGSMLNTLPIFHLVVDNGLLFYFVIIITISLLHSTDEKAETQRTVIWPKSQKLAIFCTQICVGLFLSSISTLSSILRRQNLDRTEGSRLDIVWLEFLEILWWEGQVKPLGKIGGLWAGRGHVGWTGHMNWMGGFWAEWVYIDWMMALELNRQY